MSSADQEGKPAASPLDAERERLRKAGYTDAEVSQILVARALATSQQPSGVAGQGVMSNVLSSLVAVASHARMLIPTFRKDVAIVFDEAATASARAGATASLAVKAVVVLVLGYAAWQEWNQHIIYATQKAAADAVRAEVESRAAAGRPIPLSPKQTSDPLAQDDAGKSREEFLAQCVKNGLTRAVCEKI